MDNLIFCLNATIPIFLLMVMGFIFKRIHIFTEEFVKCANSFVFKIALPVLVFKDLSGEDFYNVWEGGYVLFCFVATSISIAIAILISTRFKDRTIRGEFAQSSYRSSAALLGIGFIQNIYGSSGMAPLMIIGTVPLYNVMAVAILEFYKPETEEIAASKHGKSKSELLKATFFDILKNPIIIGIAVGIIWSLIGIPQPVIFSKSVTYISNLATPLGLMALGASIEFSKTKDKLAPAAIATFMKLVVFCAIFLPVAVSLGYRTDKLIAVLVMLGSPTTVSSFVMAKSMGHDGTVSASTVMFTTLISAFTLTLWLYILKSMGYV